MEISHGKVLKLGSSPTQELPENVLFESKDIPDFSITLLWSKSQLAIDIYD